MGLSVSKKSMRTILAIALLTCTHLVVSGQSPRPSVCTGGILNGKAIYIPEPLYPLEFKESIRAQTITVRVEVNEQGYISAAKACSGHESLRHLVEEAARRAKITPTTFSGVPVRVSGLFIFRFDPETSYSKPYKLSCERSMNSLKLLNAYALDLKKPEYPASMREQKITGAVSVQVRVDRRGEVNEATAISGHEALRPLAVEAAKRSTFRRFERCGEPVEVASTVFYNFPPGN